MNYASNQMHKLLKGWILNYLFKLSLQFLRKFYQFTWWKGQDSGNVCCNLYFFFPKIISVAQFSLLLLLFSHSVVSNSLWPHGLQHARLPCPLISPGICSNSCPLNPWCQPTISSSVIPFSSCLQFFPVSESFPVSQSFTSGGQRIGVSTSASVLPMNIQDWFPLGWTALVFL